MGSDKTLWEILVPTSSNEGLEFELDHHQRWDEHVRSIAGGVTILKTARGQWVSPDGDLFAERMIPVRIYATEPQIDEVIAYTLTHYDQEAVLAYEVSSLVKLVYR